MIRNRTWLALGAYSISASAHAWFLVAPPQLTVPKRTPPPPSAVQFVVAASKPEPPPEPEAPQPPPPLPKPEPPPLKPATEPPPEAEPVPAETSPQEPAAATPELTGTTLLAEGQGPLGMEAGSGASRSGPVVAGLSRRAPERVTARPAPAPQPAGPRVEPLKDLLKRPVPPDLGDSLRRNYPSLARAQGKSGEAKIRARVDADGRIRVTQLVSESASGFGSSCEKTLKQSRWSAPLHHSGQAVATWISYRCSFKVDQ
jgi:TonB family protein